MDPDSALVFLEQHGVVLMSAKGPVPSLAAAIAGGSVRGSWWSHPAARRMYRVFAALAGSEQVLTCRLVGGKVTFVHRRLWPALVRLARRVPAAALAAVAEEHTARGHHRTVATPFPRWVPAAVSRAASRLGESEAAALLGPSLLAAIGASAPRTATRTPRSRSPGSSAVGSTAVATRRRARRDRRRRRR